MSASSPPPVGAAFGGSASGDPATILIVEDEEAVCALLEMVLRGQGFDLLVARTGQQAREASQQHPGPIHLLLSDWYLPDVGGQELARQLKSARPEMKVLFMSGSDRTAAGQSPENFLSKPFTTGGLLEKIRSVLQPAK